MSRFLPSVLLAALLLGGCATSSAEFPDATPNGKPALDTDEAGLWRVTDKVEAKMRSSPRRVRDEALNTYLKDITCRVTGEFCGSIRVYLIEQPAFNAFMFPNGAMGVWTGLLLRAENEAQLATVLGHEAGHFVERHSLQQYRALVNAAGGLSIFSVVAAGAGVGGLSQIAALGVAGSLASYSRTQESEADAFGIKVLADAGYDPEAAPAVWRALIDEIGDEEARKTSFLASHPAPPERVAALETQARTIPTQNGELGRKRYLEVTEPYVERWVRAEIRRRKPDQTLRLFERLQTQGRDPGLMEFAKGEVHRQRWDKTKDDPQKAIAAYKRAIEARKPPADAYKGLGLAYRKSGQAAAADEAFRDYLAVAPDADDRAVIEKLLAE